MKMMPTRRAYRRVFRKMRFYIPLVLLLLALMVLFLPLSAGWMARRAEREVLERLGLDVKLERLEITLATARIEIKNAIMHGGREEPFRLRRIQLDGELRGLLAGGESWPNRVIVSGAPTLRLVRNAEGHYRLAGPFKSLLDEIQRLANGQTPAGKPQSGANGRRSGRTPEIVLYDISLEMEQLRPDLPPLRVALDEVIISERATSTSPVRMHLRGLATAATTEDLELNLVYFPDQERVTLRGSLTGLAIPFFIPDLGRFHGRTRNLRLDINAQRMPGGELSGALTMQAGWFEISREGVGGERWSDSPLEARLQFSFDEANQIIRAREVSFLGDQIDVSARGSLSLQEDLEGAFSLSVVRLPTAALALGQTELLNRLNLRVESTDSSPTLRLEVAASGSFLRPLEMKSQASVLLKNWAFSSPDFPETAYLEDLDFTITDRRFTLRSLRANLGAMKFGASGDLPIYNDDHDGPAGSMRLTADGDAESAVEILQRLDRLPREVDYLRAPVRLDTSIQAKVRRDLSSGTVVLEENIQTARGLFSWREGELGLRRFPEGIELQPGAVRLEEGRIELERLRASSGSLSVNASGSVFGGPILGEGEPLTFHGDLISRGEIAELLYYLGGETSLPRLPQDLAGRYDLQFTATGSGDDVEDTNYSARLLLNRLSATVFTPYKALQTTSGTLELLMTRDEVRIRNGAITVVDDKIGNSTLELRALATADRLRVDGSARSSFELLTSLIPGDLNDLYMSGRIPVSGWAEARPAEELPEGPDVLRRWIAFFTQPDITIDVKPGAELLVDFEAVYRQEAPVSVFPRDFPVAISNIRAGARFTPNGIEIREGYADIGSAKDAKIKGLVQLGKPVRITFDIFADKIDVNEWMEGWGERPWASVPFTQEPRWMRVPESYQFVDISGRVATRHADFLQFSAQDVVTDLYFEAWSRQPGRLWLRDFSADLYGGRGTSPEISLVFIKEETPILEMNADVVGANLQEFMNDLLEREQSMDGLLSANLFFQGQLVNYPTYRGNATYFVEQSSVVGNVILEYWRDLLQAGSTRGGRDSTIDGSVFMEDQRVHFVDLEIMSPVVNITADGYVDFRARLNFDVTASVISKRLKTIPFLGFVGNLWDFVGKEIISYKLEGTLENPRYYAIPTVVDRLEKITKTLRKAATRDQSAPRETTP